MKKKDFKDLLTSIDQARKIHRIRILLRDYKKYLKSLTLLQLNRLQAEVDVLGNRMWETKK